MTPIPDDAVELAARAMAWADRDPRRSLSKTNPETFWRALPPNCHEYRMRMARAALPALREAVAGECLALADEIEKSACRAPLVIDGSAVAFSAITIDSWTAKLRIIAALTEQENRNG